MNIFVEKGDSYSMQIMWSKNILLNHDIFNIHISKSITELGIPGLI